MTRVLKISAAALLAGAAFVSAAQAGGYGRGSANIDPLFDEGTSASTSLSITAPSRGVDTRNGVATNAAQGAEFTETYATFGASVATDIVGGLRCAATYAQPYGANADYGTSKIALGSGTTTSSALASSELGLTCGYGFDAGPGKLHVIGGVFHQALDYNEIRGFGAASIDMSDGALGYRLGVGYTIPEYAVKASLMYRSAVDHRMEGIQTITGLGNFNIYADATTPQSVKLSLQSGIAPGWLAFGSVEWTDWSVLQRIGVNLQGTTVPSPGAPSIDAYFKDGWTVTAGVGHKFNDLFSGSFSVTWDSGVSEQRAAPLAQSGFTDTWTLALGGAFTPNANTSLRAGIAYSILTSGTERSNGVLLGYGTDHAISVGLQGNVKF